MRIYSDALGASMAFEKLLPPVIKERCTDALHGQCTGYRIASTITHGSVFSQMRAVDECYMVQRRCIRLSHTHMVPASPDENHWRGMRSVKCFNHCRLLQSIGWLAVCSPWKVSIRVILTVLVLKALSALYSSSASHLISSEVGSWKFWSQPCRSESA